MKTFRTYQVNFANSYGDFLTATRYFNADNDNLTLEHALNNIPIGSKYLRIAPIDHRSLLSPVPACRRKMLRYSDEQLRKKASDIVDALERTCEQQFDLLRYVFTEMSRRTGWIVDAPDILSFVQDGLFELAEEEMEWEFY